MKFILWISVTIVKWISLFASIPFADGIPPPAWVSEVWIAFIFLHLAAEFLFPLGGEAFEAIYRQSCPRILWLVGVGIGVFLASVSLAVRLGWLSLSEVRFGFYLGLGLLGVWWLLSYAALRDYLIARHWPHVPVS